MDGIEISCGRCAARFLVCSGCWRGQRYCSPGCVRAARLARHRVAQARYSKTARGRASHRQRQKSYRRKNFETDQTTGNVEDAVNPAASLCACVFCGRPVREKHSSQEPYFSFRRRRDAECGSSGRDSGALLREEAISAIHFDGARDSSSERGASHKEKSGE